MKTSAKTSMLVRLALLVAIIFLLEVTNLAFLHIGPLEMTILQVPVLVGAIVLGPTAGAVLGGVFGLMSFWECFGKSAFGAVLLGIDPLFTFIVCFPTRLLMGWLCGIIFRALRKADKTKILSFAAASLSGALLNTLFFMTALLVLFGSTDYIMGFRGDLGVIPFVIAFVGLQGLVEAIICFLAGTAISKALYKTFG